MNENTSMPKYNIKVLASNIVLVESNNYESEIFTPYISNGRITFLNVIPNRRCCQITKRNIKIVKRESPQSSNFSEANKHLDRLSSSQRLISSTPLAKSTPVYMKQRQSDGGQFSNFYSRLSAITSTLPTPEPARRDIPVNNMLMENSLNIPTGIKVSKIYPKRTPKKLGRLVTSANSVQCVQNSADVSFLDSNFKLLCSPTPSKVSKNKNRTENLLNSAPNDCIARWQKVLTPVRTYSRNSKKPVMINRPKTIDNFNQRRMSTMAKPSHLHNPTQGLNVSTQIEIKKCRLIIDRKTTISPRSFKIQQKQPADSYTSKSSFRSHIGSLSFRKPRAYLERMGMSAFDLLTNSNRTISNKLNEQFRKRCVNKASSTYIKYKAISVVPPIEQDEQVLELSLIYKQTPQEYS